MGCEDEDWEVEGFDIKECEVEAFGEKVVANSEEVSFCEGKCCNGEGFKGRSSEVVDCDEEVVEETPCDDKACDLNACDDKACDDIACDDKACDGKVDDTLEEKLDDSPVFVEGAIAEKRIFAEIS